MAFGLRIGVCHKFNLTQTLRTSISKKWILRIREALIVSLEVTVRLMPFLTLPPEQGSVTASKIHVYLSTNAEGTLNLLECMRETGCKKFVYASTSSLYAGQKMPFTEELAVNEPLSPYAASKKAGELMAYSYHKLYQIDISVVRYFTVFGPAGRPDMSIFRFIKWIYEGAPIQIFEDGSQSRDFTYVDDIARGTIAAIQDVGYEIFNLGGGRNPVSLNTIISRLEELLGKKAKINHKPFHVADLMETWADISRQKGCWIGNRRFLLRKDSKNQFNGTWTTDIGSRR